jgi:hypothetical protein
MKRKAMTAEAQKRWWKLMTDGLMAQECRSKRMVAEGDQWE